MLLHERLVPYVRAAAATASRCGLPVIRPLLLSDPAEPRGWALADVYGFGPALWVAPVLERGATEREVFLPRGEWIDFWSGERVEGGREVMAAAPVGRIPVWVRSGSLVVTYPASHVRDGPGRRARARAAARGHALGRAAAGQDRGAAGRRRAGGVVRGPMGATGRARGARRTEVRSSHRPRRHGVHRRKTSTALQAVRLRQGTSPCTRSRTTPS
ncbi:MAG: hypothetical protein WKF31_02575 [Thermoleophilaceae bacterium]